MVTRNVDELLGPVVQVGVSAALVKVGDATVVVSAVVLLAPEVPAQPT